MSNNIEGKIIIITGASSGLGEAAAGHLSDQPATVVLGARRLECIRALADELSARGGKALAVKTDVAHRDQVEALVKAAIDTFGPVDVMLNNAGILPQAPMERLKMDE